MNKIKKAFIDKGITQKMIMDDLKVSQPYASGLINGKKPIGKKMADKIYSIYGIEKTLLLTGESLEINSDDNDESLIDTDIEKSLLSTIISEKDKRLQEKEKYYSTIIKEKDERIKDKESAIQDKVEIINLLKQQLATKSPEEKTNKGSDIRTV